MRWEELKLLQPDEAIRLQVSADEDDEEAEDEKPSRPKRQVSEAVGEGEAEKKGEGEKCTSEDCYFLQESMFFCYGG